MSQDLQTVIAALIAAVVGWLMRQFTGQPAKPAADPVPATPTPATPINPAPTADPYDGLPGLPGHPFLRLVGPALLRWIGIGGSVQMFGAEGDPSVDDEAAMTVLAAAIRRDPARAARMRAHLQ